MDKYVLEVKKRDTKNTSVHDVRSLGLIPGECYGSGEDNVSVQVEYQAFRKIYNTAGENSVVDLSIDGTVHKVLIHQMQREPLHGRITHVDFKFIDMKKKVTAYVPVHHEGIAPAVKDLGGILTENMHEIEVKCLPGDIPHEFIVDISVLVDFHSSIHVSDIPTPAGVEILSDPELTVASVVAPRMEEETSAEDEAAAIAELGGGDKEGEEGEKGSDEDSEE